MHTVQLRHAVTGRTSPEKAVKTMLLREVFFVGSNVHLLKFRHHSVEMVRRLGWVY